MLWLDSSSLVVRATNRNADTLRARTTAAGVRPWPASWLLWRWHSPAGFLVALYREAVTFHSPGSPRFAAHPG